MIIFKGKQKEGQMLDSACIFLLNLTFIFKVSKILLWASIFNLFCSSDRMCYFMLAHSGLHVFLVDCTEVVLLNNDVICCYSLASRYWQKTKAVREYNLG